MKSCVAENMPPATPPNDAPIANASSLTLRVLMPIALAAISSSRIASQARPRREFCSRRLTTMTPISQQQQQVVVLDCGPVKSMPSDRLACLANEKLPMRNGSISVDALRPVGDVDRRVQVVEEDADDLAEAERDDRQVVAAQLQRRRAEQHAEQAGDRRADRQDDPERQVQAEVRRREQRVDVGADGVERDVAEVEQAGEADDDVEAERQQHVEHREVEDAHPRRGRRRPARTAARPARSRPARRRPTPCRGLLLRVDAACRMAIPSGAIARRVRRAGPTAGRSARGSARRRRTRPGSCCRTALSLAVVGSALLLHRVADQPDSRTGWMTSPM